MTDSPQSPFAFFFWHDWVGDLAFVLLGVLFIYTVVQHVAARLSVDRAPLFARRSLRSNLVIGLTLIGSIPAATLGLLLAERSAQFRQERIAGNLSDLARSMARDVDQFLDLHRSGIQSAANSISLAGAFEPEALSMWLQNFHATYPDFLTMLATDSDGDIVTATSLISGLPAPVTNLAGQNVSDRPYFLEPMQSGDDFLSRVFQGRGLGRDPIVAISATLEDARGQRRGIVEGSLNLRAFSHLESDRVLPNGAAVVVLDPEKRVIYASESAQHEVLESLIYDPLVAALRSADAGESFQFSSHDGTESQRFIGASGLTASGWTVLTHMPSSQIEQQMVGDYKVVLLLLVVTIALSLALAAAIVRRVTRPITDLTRLVNSFNLDGRGEEVVMPATTPAEFHCIYEQIRRRSQNLRNTHERLSKSIAIGEKLRHELTQANVLKDQEIEERTAKLEEANNELEALTRRDALTGIANRRGFERFQDRVWRLCARERSEVTTIMIDIDHFKSYNDSQGHQRGDDALREVATAIAECASRPMDMVARYGGEEFVAVLAATPMSNALIVGENMRRAVQALAIPHPDSPLGVITVSVGVASARPSAHNQPRAALQAADEALYNAKAAGRNRVVYADDGRFEVHDATTPGNPAEPQTASLRD